VRFEMEGVIAAAGFASGDRVVIGHWVRSPLGAMDDVMWAEPDGTRVLYAADERAAEFITAVYRFDRVEVGPVLVDRTAEGLHVRVAGREVHLHGGRSVPIPWRGRPAWVTRWVEGPIARALLRVRTYGTSPTGVHEWYRADRWTPLRDATGSIDGRDLGTMTPVRPACRFGFSEPPRRPSLTSVRPLLDDPAGHLDRVVESHTGVGS